MATFWLIACALILAAVAIVLVPLLRGARTRTAPAAESLNLTLFKDKLEELEADVASGVLGEDQFEEGRLDLERELLDETERTGDNQPYRAATSRPWLAIVLALALPAVSITLYLQLGQLDLAMDAAPAAALEAVPPLGHSELESAVEGLAKRLEAQPNDPTGWSMLGRSYMMFGEHQKAADAFAMAYELVGDHPDLLVAYADALVMANGGHFDEMSTGLVSRALEIAPDHVKAIWLAGTVAHRQGNHARALELWERLAALAPEGSDLARTAANNSAEARVLIRGEEANPAAAGMQDGAIQ